MTRFLLSATLVLLASGVPGQANDWISYEGKSGPGAGKHLVFLSGDEEYRSEEGLPMLAKILSQRHGFKCTVLFAVDEDGTINPEAQDSLSGSDQIASADAIIMLLRFRNWPDDTMKKFVDRFESGVPIIALRTSTHAFNYRKDRNSQYASYNDFGDNVLGENWVSHWGKHKKEATLGVVESSAKDHPILNGVGTIFGDSDVYEAHPPADADILVRGQVLTGMNPDDAAATYTKKRKTDSQEQLVNDPMMPVAWTRTHKHKSGVQNKIFCTTLGAATDLQTEGTRRMVVNAVYWVLGMEVPSKADVAFVDPFHPTMYGFGTYRRGITAADHALGKVLREGDPQPPQRGKAKRAKKKSKPE